MADSRTPSIISLAGAGVIIPHLINVWRVRLYELAHSLKSGHDPLSTFDVQTPTNELLRDRRPFHVQPEDMTLASTTIERKMHSFRAARATAFAISYETFRNAVISSVRGEKDLISTLSHRETGIAHLQTWDIVDYILATYGATAILHEDTVALVESLKTAYNPASNDIYLHRDEYRKKLDQLAYVGSAQSPALAFAYFRASFPPAFELDIKLYVSTLKGAEPTYEALAEHLNVTAKTTTTAAYTAAVRLVPSRSTFVASAAAGSPSPEDAYSARMTRLESLVETLLVAATTVPKTGQIDRSRNRLQTRPPPAHAAPGTEFCFHHGSRPSTASTWHWSCQCHRMHDIDPASFTDRQRSSTKPGKYDGVQSAN